METKRDCCKLLGAPVQRNDFLCALFGTFNRPSHRETFTQTSLRVSFPLFPIFIPARQSRALIECDVAVVPPVVVVAQSDKPLATVNSITRPQSRGTRPRVLPQRIGG